MAFQWQTFRTRALTAIVFVAVMAIGLLWSRWSFFVLFSIVHFGGWLEYQKLVSLFNPDYKSINAAHKYGVMLGGWCAMLFFTNSYLQIGGVHLHMIGLWVGIAFLLLFPVAQLVGNKAFYLKNIGYSLAGLVYISLPLALMVNLRNRWGTDLDLTIPLLIIFTIWINDTMAYVVGSFIGKTPFSPISPKKTWEGTIGGAILAVVVMSLIAYFTGRLSVLNTAIISAIAAVSGTYGDLFESKLKRMAGVKDSGSFMPGHGGFLDRFDSLLFASTCVWMYAVWIK